MPNWVTGIKLVKQFGIHPYEFFTDYIQNKCLQPHDQSGCAVSPSDLMEVILNEKFSRADHSLEAFQVDSDDTSVHPQLAYIPRSTTIMIANDYTPKSLEQASWSNFELPLSPTEAESILKMLTMSWYSLDEVNKFHQTKSNSPTVNKQRISSDYQAEKMGINFVGLKELEEMKAISVFTLRKYAKNEGMPHRRVGNKILVDPLEFDKWFLNKNAKNSDDTEKSISDMLEEAVSKIV